RGSDPGRGQDRGRNPRTGSRIRHRAHSGFSVMPRELLGYAIGKSKDRDSFVRSMALLEGARVWAALDKRAAPRAFAEGWRSLSNGASTAVSGPPAERSSPAWCNGGSAECRSTIPAFAGDVDCETGGRAR